MANRILVHQHGGAEVLQYQAYDVPAPGPGEAAIRHDAIGLNFIDVYFRTGLYPAPLPLSRHGRRRRGRGGRRRRRRRRPGQRVAYAGAPIGAYADIRVMPAEKLVPLPDAISADTAAAMMLKGMTAQYLLRQTYAVQAGRHDPVPCRGGRRGPDRLPMGQASGRHGHRHGRLGRKGGARARTAASTSSTTTARTSRPGQGDHRRQGRAGRL